MRNLPMIREELDVLIGLKLYSPEVRDSDLAEYLRERGYVTRCAGGYQLTTKGHEEVELRYG